MIADENEQKRKDDFYEHVKNSLLSDSERKEKLYRTANKYGVVRMGCTPGNFTETEAIAYLEEFGPIMEAMSKRSDKITAKRKKHGKTKKTKRK